MKTLHLWKLKIWICWSKPEDIDDDDIENDDDIIESKLIRKPLFYVHLDADDNQEVVGCLAK